MKNVDTREYLNVLEKLIHENEIVTIPVSGYSMNPFLADKRDAVMVQTPDQKLKTGDMVLYKRKNGQYILHRIRKIREDGFYMVGDGQTEIEGPISETQVIGKVIRVNRKGKWIDERTPVWRFFETVWIRIVPIRPMLRKSYSWYVRLRTKRET